MAKQLRAYKLTCGKYLAVPLFIICQLAWSQEISSLKATEEVDSLLYSSREIGESIKNSSEVLLKQEKSIGSEVRRGIARITKLCPDATSNKTLVAPESPPQKALDYLSAKQIYIDEILKESAKKTSDDLARLEPLRAANCSKLLIRGQNKACLLVAQQNKNLQEIQTARKLHLEAVQQRYAYFKDAANKEATGCVKPGFSDKLLKANEEHLVPYEKTAIERYEELQRQVRALMARMEAK